MPRKRGDKKTELTATRLTPLLKKAVEREARRVGMDVSEWIRNLIVRELREKGGLPNRHAIEEERGDQSS